MSCSPPPSYESTFPSNSPGASSQGGNALRSLGCNCRGGDTASHGETGECRPFSSASHWSEPNVTLNPPSPFSHGPMSTRRPHSWHPPLLHCSPSPTFIPIPPPPSPNTTTAATATVSTEQQQQQQEQQQQPLLLRGQPNELDSSLSQNRGDRPPSMTIPLITAPPLHLFEAGYQSGTTSSSSSRSLPGMVQDLCPQALSQQELDRQEQQPPVHEIDQTLVATDATTSPGSIPSQDTPLTQRTSFDNPTPPMPDVDQPHILPPAGMTLSLGSLSNFHPQRQHPVFSPADAPPPYSPTHTILPHYFSLVPIPIRSYTIKESPTLPALLDFWLHTTSNTTRPTSPAHEQLQLQERGLPPQSEGPEHKYSLIRPTQTDRTATPPGHSSFTQHAFVPPCALVRADLPARWLWWGTEALHLVVFGRQLKNVYMEWRWRRGRSRIGGPVITRLIGCSFRITPERGYCWREGTGRATNLTMSPPPSARSQRRRSAMEATRRRPTSTVVDMGQASQDSTAIGGGRVASPQDPRAASRSIFSFFFRQRHRLSATAPETVLSSPPTAPANVEMQDMVSTNLPETSPLDFASPTQEALGHIAPGPDATVLDPLDGSRSVALSDIGEEGLLGPDTNSPLSRATTHDNARESLHHLEDGGDEEEEDDDDDDDDVGVYHCREESIEGVPGRLVAVYRPERAANRARDIPARGRKLEIYAEIGERCETALMFMCTRLDDLFMSIPESKRTPARRQRRRQRGRSMPSMGTRPLSFGPLTLGGLGAGSLAVNGQAGGEGGGQGVYPDGQTARGGDMRDVDLLRRRSLEGPMTVKAFLRQDKTKRILKMVVAMMLIILVVVLVLRSPRSRH